MKPPACHVGRLFYLLDPRKPPSVSYQQTSSILISTPGLLGFWAGRSSGRGTTSTAAPGSPIHASSAMDMSKFIGMVAWYLLGPVWFLWDQFFWARLPGSGDISADYPAGTSLLCFGPKHWYGVWRMPEWGGIGIEERWVKKVVFFSCHRTWAEPRVPFGSWRLKAN